MTFLLRDNIMAALGFEAHRLGIPSLLERSIDGGMVGWMDGVGHKSKVTLRSRPQFKGNIVGNLVPPFDADHFFRSNPFITF